MQVLGRDAAEQRVERHLGGRDRRDHQAPALDGNVDFRAVAQVHASLANQMEGARITEVTDDEAEQLAANLESTSLDKGKGKAAEDVPYEDASFREYASNAVCCAS